MERWQILISTVLAIATFAFGIWKYGENSSKEAQAALLEASKPYLNRQLDLCFEASETVSILGTTDNIEHWMKAKQRFWFLYYGPLAIVEVPFAGDKGDVSGRMYDFGQALNAIQVTAENTADVDIPFTELAGKALSVSRACRELILYSWGLKQTD